MKRLLIVVLIALGLGTAQAAHLEVSLEDLLSLAENEISEETILAVVQTRQITFAVDAEAIVRLRRADLSEEVIRALLKKTKGANGAPGTDPNRPVVVYAYPPYYYWSDYWPSVFVGLSLFPGRDLRRNGDRLAIT